MQNVNVVEEGPHANSNRATVCDLDVVAMRLIASDDGRLGELHEAGTGGRLTLPHSMSAVVPTPVVAVLVVGESTTSRARVGGGNGRGTRARTSGLETLLVDLAVAVLAAERARLVLRSSLRCCPEAVRWATKSRDGDV